MKHIHTRHYLLAALLVSMTMLPTVSAGPFDDQADGTRDLGDQCVGTQESQSNGSCFCSGIHYQDGQLDCIGKFWRDSVGNERCVY